MLTPEQVARYRAGIDADEERAIIADRAREYVPALLADRAEIAQELGRIQANAFMASREQTINALTALIERIKA